MKTWQVYKMIDEWDGYSDSPVLLNKNNNIKYEFKIDDGRKGLRKHNDKLSPVKRSFTLDHEWEEYVELYEKGEWVIADGKCLYIDEINSKYFFDYTDMNNSYSVKSIERRALKSEVKAENIRRKWAKLGRYIGEFRKGDIVSVPHTARIPAGLYDVIQVHPLILSSESEGEFNSEQHKLGKLKLVCLSENRINNL